MMTQTHDYRYHYPDSPVPCRIRVYQAGTQTVCLTTQRQDKFGGAAITDHAAPIATQVEGWHHADHDGRFTWVEHYEFPLGPDAQGRWETFAFVTFERRATRRRTATGPGQAQAGRTRHGRGQAQGDDHRLAGRRGEARAHR
jgi:hypothetical protein